MGERPDWTGTLLRERLLRPTVAGHGVPADSRRDNTLLPHPYSDELEARGRGLSLGSVEGLSGPRPLGTEARGRGQEALDPTMASQSWRTRYKAAFEAYAAELTRQGWELSTGSFWGDYITDLWPKGWNEDDFNAELLRHGCAKHDWRAHHFWSCLVVRRQADARHKMQDERVHSGGSRTDTWARNVRHACSGMRVRRSCRVTPSPCTAASAPSAASEGGACPKHAGALGGSGRAAGALVAVKVLNEYTCPVTAEIMTEPVSTLDGFTYERAAITEWLRTSDTSPPTGAKLETQGVIPNTTVRCPLERV